MLIKNIFMELRSRLRSCNVYITTTVDFKVNCNLKISIQADNIVLSYYNEALKRRDSTSSIESLSDCCSDDDSDTTVISLLDFCQIIPNSMSGLKVDRNNISFRVLTESDNGSFYSEFLTESNEQRPNRTDLMKINIRANEAVVLSCQNCSNAISEGSIKFGRVLELPTSNLDMSEWFCHNHSDHSPTTTTVITPNKTDFLYRLTHFVVDTTLLSPKTNKFNIKRDVYHCNRCLAWLGMKTNRTVKLYNSTVTMNETPVFKTKVHYEDVSTNDFIYTVESMIKEFDVGFQYTIMCKIVLSSVITPSVTQYILIWVMDKALQVLQNSSETNMTLKSSSLTKLLYKVVENSNEEVQSWLDDPAVVTSEISKKMICSGQNHLLTMSLRVPEPFRTNNGFTISYLKL